MSFFSKTMAATVFAVALMFSASQSWAQDNNTVQKFYDFLSNPGSKSHAAAFVKATKDNWVSVGNYSGKNKTRDAFLGQIGGFAKLIPDLDWAVESMTQEGNTVVVRSRATGTPKGPLFGVDGKGRGFDIMTIDIHEIEDGLIARSYHVEDWAGALQQLKGPKQDPNKDPLKVVQKFMGALGKDDTKTMSSLMAKDMVWLNEGDKTMPWIGPWSGKQQIFAFLKTFGKNVKTTQWDTDSMFAVGDTVVAFGKMKLVTTKSGKETDEFTFALRVKVLDGKIVLWNWFEDSFAVSNAYHGK